MLEYQCKDIREKMTSTLDDLQSINQLTIKGLLLTCYSLIILVVLGLVRNLLSAFIFLQQKFRLNSYVYFTFFRLLATFD